MMFRVRVQDQEGTDVAAVPFEDWEAAIDYAIMAREGEYKIALDYALPCSMVDLAQLTVPDAVALIAMLTEGVTEALQHAAEYAVDEEGESW